MTSQPWMKFYPRDWRGDQALRVVSLAARGLWIEMISIMHEANPYGHLMVGDQPLAESALARVVGSTVEEVQALLVELGDAGVFRRTRSGVIYSKRMTDDHKRSKEGRKAKLEALEKTGKKSRPSSPPSRLPPTQRPEARVEVEGPKAPSTLYDSKNDFLGPKDVRDSFVRAKGDEWVRSYVDPCAWQDVPERALIPKTPFAGNKLIREGRRVLAEHGLTVLEAPQSARRQAQA